MFGVFPTFPAVAATLTSQEENIEAQDAARKEMETVTTEVRIQQAMRAKIRPATKYLVEPGDSVLVYREKSKRYMGPFTVSNVCEKKVILELNGV